MTNSSAASPQRSAAGVSLRKTNKPLMEKRRRARINDSLSQLKSLVIQGTKKDSSQFNKLEKADILELTVKHLRHLQTREQQQQLSHGSGAEPNSAGKYCAGFMECANEVIHYLKQSQGFSDDTKARVVGHLASCLQFTNQPYAKPATQMTTPSPLLTAPSAPVINTAQPTTAATQLVNGQIIHIVNTPFQTAMTPVGQYPSTDVAVQMSAQPQLSESASTLASAPRQAQHEQSSPLSQQSIVHSSIVPSAMSSPSLIQDKSYMRFSQPLHIQIPQSVSPFVIKAESCQVQDLRRIDDSSTHYAAPEHVPSVSTAETVQSYVSPASPSPLPREYMSKPTVTHKQAHYYASDIHNDYIPRSRTYSTTSSSSECEMSPLNLSSHSPYSSSSTSSSYDSQRESTYHHNIRLSTAGDYHYPAGYRLEQISPAVSHYHSGLKDNVDISHSNFTSVIVNAPRPLDVPTSKYMSMDMDEDRLCSRHHGTPSPASSMGEERLWRPW